MVLTVHHLSVSQSERITWLLEELNIPYELKVYKRNQTDSFAPAELKSLPGNIMESAPVFHDSETDVILAESGAIFDYVFARYGSGNLVPDVEANPKAYAAYADWLHRANASFLPALSGSAGPESPRQQLMAKRFQQQLDYAEAVLGKGKWLAGEQFTAADVMTHFVFNNMRFFFPLSLRGYSNILRWTGDCARRPAFQQAFKKGDPEILGMMPLGEDPPTEEQKPWKH